MIEYIISSASNIKAACILFITLSFSYLVVSLFDSVKRIFKIEYSTEFLEPFLILSFATTFYVCFQAKYILDCCRDSRSIEETASAAREHNKRVEQSRDEECRRSALEGTRSHFGDIDDKNIEILSKTSVISFRSMNLYIISVNKDGNISTIMYLVSLDLQERALCEMVPGILRQIHVCSKQGLSRRMPLSTILKQSLGGSVHIQNL